MDLAGRTIARQLAMTFEQSVVANDNPLRINFRCHICGDSKEDPYKKRGWFVELDGEIHYKCFNCDYSDHISKYLKHWQPNYYSDYLMERRRDKADLDFTNRKPKEIKTAVMPKVESLPHCDSIYSLSDDHPVKKYIKLRKIPKKFWKDIFFTKEFKALANTIKPETYRYERPENRIIIPLRNSKGEIESIQGRALSKDSNAKYMTIKPHDKASKLYGADRVDDSKDVFCLEGAFDAMFIKNAIAITGGTLDPDLVPYDHRVWVLDNEPRAIDTVNRIEKLIESGERVVIFEQCPFEGKDVNTFVQNGADIREINLYLRDHIYSGNMALLKFSKWRKV